MADKAKKVAVVTGSNKGLGKGIVRGLCKQFDGHVYVTARDPKSGQQAVEDLKKEGLSPCFHQLDITDPKSIDNLRLHLEQNYGGLDVLVNNAGMAYGSSSTAPFSEQAEVTNKTNFTGTVDVCHKLFPLLRDHARVVHIASTVGSLTLGQCAEAVKNRVKNLKTISEVQKFIQEFVDAAKSDTASKIGLPKSSYGISKMAVNMITPIQQEILDKDKTKKDVIVNSCCPGHVATDMTSNAPGKGLTPDEAADTPVYLALLPPDNAANPRGKFLRTRKVRDLECDHQEFKQAFNIP